MESFYFNFYIQYGNQNHTNKWGTLYNHYPLKIIAHFFYPSPQNYLYGHLKSVPNLAHFTLSLLSQ